MRYFKKKRPKLERTLLLIKVIADYYNFKFFTTIKLLN